MDAGIEMLIVVLSVSVLVGVIFLFARLFLFEIDRLIVEQMERDDFPHELFE